MKKLLIFLLIIIGIIVSILSFPYFVSQQECPDDYSGLLSETANRFNINIPANSIKIESQRCSVKVPYRQVELKGKYADNNGESHSYYFLMVFGGMAASGSDSYNEICLNIDDKNEILRIEKGAQLTYLGPAKCRWQSNYP